MCERCAAPNGPWSVARRSVLKLGLAAAMALAPQALMAKSKEPPKPENVLSPDAALDRLMQGNARYVDGVSRRHDFKHEREPLSRGQNPFAAVLSCADSRIAPDTASIPRAAMSLSAASPATSRATSSSRASNTRSRC